MPLLLNVRSSLVSYWLWIELSKPAEQFFPSPLGSSIDERELLPQCMPAFDMVMPVTTFLMYREQGDEINLME